MSVKSMKWKKLGQILKPEKLRSWWQSHAMAPSAVLLNSEVIRVYLGCWDREGISRIGYLDVSADNPLEIRSICEHPVLDIGVDGAFDENGVFPGHAYRHGDQIRLYYTGFQLGHKIRHYNFGGLALGALEGEPFKRISQAPILDRADEGLMVRAGQSVLFEQGRFRSVYSAGSGWVKAGQKQRPVYDVYYQDSADGIVFGNEGVLIASSDRSVEHGLGRPQIVKLNGQYYVFYTRRMLNMKYWLGAVTSSDCVVWERVSQFSGLDLSPTGWDSEMVYFPSVLSTDRGVFLFYSGNGFGRDGFGVARLEE